MKIPQKSEMSLLDVQRHRWAKNDRVLVEQLLTAGDSIPDTDVLDLIYSEILLREEVGELPVVTQYCRRFPQLSDQIRRQFQLHQAIVCVEADVERVNDISVEEFSGPNR